MLSRLSQLPHFMRISVLAMAVSAVLASLAMLLHGRAIERDISARTIKALAADGQSWGKIEVHGRDVTLKSTSPDKWSQTQAIATIKRTYGVRRLDDQSEVLPAKSPFGWRAQINAAGVELSGYIPPYGERDAILEIAGRLFAGREIIDNMALATGTPAKRVWIAAMTQALEHLKRLRQGHVALSDLQLEVAGQAASFADYDALDTALATSTSAVQLANRDVIPPSVTPFVWGAAVADKSVTFTGYFASRAAISTLSERARAAGFSVTALAPYGHGADDEWLQWATFALDRALALRRGNVSLVDNTLSISGQAADFAGFDGLNAALQAPLPAGLQIKSAIIEPPLGRPYIWSLHLEPPGLALKGYVPSPEQRRQLIASAPPNVSVSDNMRLASGAPPGWPAAMMKLAEAVNFMERGEIRMRDGTVQLSGAAKDPRAYGQIRDLLSAPELALLKNIRNDIPPPVQSPYVLSIVKQDNTVTLSGYALDAQSRDRLVSEVSRQMPGTVVTAAIDIAHGAPRDWQSGVAFMLTQVALTQSAEARLSDLDLSFRGVGATPQSYDALVRALSGRLPGALRLVASETLPPRIENYTWRAVIDADTVVISGAVPDKASRANILTHLKTVLPDVKLEDKTYYAAGAPPGWLEAIRFLLDQAGDLEAGAEIAVENGKLHVNARARSPQAYLEVVEKMAAVPQGFERGDVIIQPPVVERYIWRVRRENGSVTLSGFIPSPAVRNIVNTSARVELADVDVRDQMLIAQGTPLGVDWGAATDYGLKLAARLASGTVFLENDTISIEGVAKTIDDYRALLAAISGELPANLYLLREVVKPPSDADAASLPYTFKATFDGRTVAVDGLARAEDVQSLNAFIATQFANAERKINIDVSARGREDVKEDIRMLLRRLAASLEGRFRIIDDSLSYFAVVQSQAQAQPEQSEIADAAATFTHANIVIEGLDVFSARRASSCESILNDFVRQHRIRFATASARLTAAGRDTLARIIGSIARCPDTRITVEGHTDSDGDADYNLALSQQRADAVVEYLVQAQIAPDRLSAIGYGETRPIATNNTEEGKSRNRRIEFRVVGARDN